MRRVWLFLLLSLHSTFPSLAEQLQEVPRSIRYPFKELADSSRGLQLYQMFPVAC